jgi:hypothetical protein
MVSLGAGWAVSWRCTPVPFVTSAAALAVCLAGGYAAWMQWQKVGPTFPGEAGGAVARIRTMAIAGVMLNAASFLLILAQVVVIALEAGGCDQAG